MMKLVRSIVTSVTEGVIKRFGGTGRPRESFADREYFQHYGFTSRPKQGAEAVVLLQGNQIIVIGSDDRRYRIPVEDGEVALYTDEGDSIHFKRGRKIMVKAGSLVDLDGGTGSTAGVVQGQCVCHFTGLPHGDVSTNVKASR
jgi:phage gp45-like